MLATLIRCLKSLCWPDRHQLGAEGSLGLILGAAELSASADSPLGLVYPMVLAVFLVNLWTVNDTCLSSPISVCSLASLISQGFTLQTFPAAFPQLPQQLNSRVCSWVVPGLYLGCLAKCNGVVTPSVGQLVLSGQWGWQQQMCQ